MAGGNRSAAAKKAWITRRRGRGGAAALNQKMKRAMSLATGEMMHGAAPKYNSKYNTSAEMGSSALVRPTSWAPAAGGTRGGTKAMTANEWLQVLAIRARK